MRTAYLVAGGVVGAGVLYLILTGRTGSSGGPREVQDIRIDPKFGTHRQIPAIFAGTDQVSTRNASVQDPRGSTEDFGGYPYGNSQPSAFAKGEPAQMKGAHWDQAEDRWVEIPLSPLDYGRPPQRIPQLRRDSNRYWDGITSYGGTEVVGQRVHLFHLRPSSPTRGYRSISGSLASIGGGMSTASRMRIPSIFVPSATS